MLEGPKYATLFDLDRKLLELRQLAIAARQGRRGVSGGADEGLECRIREVLQGACFVQGEAAVDLARHDRPVAVSRQRHHDRGASHRRVRRGPERRCCARRPTTGSRNERSPKPGATRCTFRRARRWTRCSGRSPSFAGRCGHCSGRPRSRCPVRSDQPRPPGSGPLHPARAEHGVPEQSNRRPA